jgi:hypothetical protein
MGTLTAPFQYHQSIFSILKSIPFDENPEYNK